MESLADNERVAAVYFGFKSNDLVAVVPIIERDLVAVPERWQQAAEAGADMIEWRGPEEIAEVARHLRTKFGLPVLATWRTDAEGGYFTLGAGAGRLAPTYAEAVRAASKWADLVDVELSRDGATKLIAEVARSTPVVASFHDFDGPVNEAQLRQHLLDMETSDATVAKVAVAVTSEEDLSGILAVQDWAQSLEVPSVIIGMGAHGRQTRLAERAARSAFAFATVDCGKQGGSSTSAPGQPTLCELRESVRKSAD